VFPLLTSTAVSENRIPRQDVDDLALAQLTEIASDEGGVLSEARGRAGLDPGLPDPPTGAFLAWIAATVDARNVVELGSASGISGLWLLRGVDARGTLTSIERDAHVRDLATEAFAAAGVDGRVRAIGGDPLEVLPRLQDGAYDLVLVQTVGRDHERMVEQTRRVVRTGGVIVVRGVATGTEQERAAKRALVQVLAEDPAFEVAVLPFGGGIAVATLS
jgi:predicted O-methyltransferase YrrM